MSTLIPGIEPFVAVAETLSFKDAAARLGVSPQAVSRAVQRLEAELGVRLLHRTTRRVALSAEGRQFFGRCKAALSELSTGRHELDLSRTAAEGAVTLSASFVLGRPLASRLPEFLERYPALQVRLQLTDRKTRLVDDGVDVALRIGTAESHTLIALKLAQPSWVTVAAPRYLARHGRPAGVEDLPNHHLLAFRNVRGTLTPWTFPRDRSTNASATAGRALPDATSARLASDQGELLVDAALAGAGIAQVFDFMVEGSLQDGSLVDVLPDQRAPAPPLVAVYLPGQRDNPRVRAVLGFLLQVFRSPVG